MPRLCKAPRQICLNRDRTQNNKLLNTCNNEPFIPIDALEKLLKYANEKETATDEITTDNNSQNCYNFDLAWKIVITDIADKIDVMKENGFEEAMNKPEIIEKLKQKLKEIPQSELKTPLNLQELFNKIIEVGRLRWDNPISCNDNTNVDCVAAAILDNLAALVESSSFKLLSDDIKNITENPNELTVDLEEEEEEESSLPEGGAPPTDNTTILDEIKSLFKYTISIMNLKGDLTNTIPKEERTVEFIKAKFQKLNEIVKKAYPVAGGKRKTRKYNKRKNSKTQKKGGLNIKKKFPKTTMVLRMAFYNIIYIPSMIGIFFWGLFIDTWEAEVAAKFVHTQATKTDEYIKNHKAIEYCRHNLYPSDNPQSVLNYIQLKYGNDTRNFIVNRYNLGERYKVESETFQEAREYYEKNHHKNADKEDVLTSIEKKYGNDAREYVVNKKAAEEEEEEKEREREREKVYAYKNFKKPSEEDREWQEKLDRIAKAGPAEYTLGAADPNDDTENYEEGGTRRKNKRSKTKRRKTKRKSRKIRIPVRR
jgi:hypothetical protein